MTNKLAISGGERTFTSPYQELWKRPIKQEKRLVNQLIDYGQVTGAGTGITKHFEEAFSLLIGCRHCLTFSQGTSALMAAYYAAGVGPGDEVLTPAVGYIGSYAGALHMGARPIFCDIDPSTWLIAPKEIRRKITERTKAINIIHLNGRVCNMDEIINISSETGIPIIDDASHAHGALWGGNKIGNYDHITCFSLQGVNPSGKPVCGGEGGVACTNNKEFYQRMLAYCHLHRKDLLADLSESTYSFLDKEVLGLKWRPHPLGIALAYISLETLNYRNTKRTFCREQTEKALGNFDFISPPRWEEKSTPAGYFGGLTFIYKPEYLDHLPPDKFIQAAYAEGVPIAGPGIGNLEYRRSLFQNSYDLWGEERGPIATPWQGLPSYTPPSIEEFAISESLNAVAFKLPIFIEVHPNYYNDLQKAFKKIERLAPRK